MTLEIKSERRNLTFSPESGLPSLPHEKAVETVKDLVRLSGIEELARVICEGCTECKRIKCHEWYIAQKIYNAGYRKQVDGDWKDSDRNGVSIKGYMVCSACDVMIPTCDDGRYCLSRLRYCPNCGAKRR